MPTFTTPVTNPARRLIVAGGFAIAIAAAPVTALAFLPPVAPVASCPAGESEDLYTDVCVPEVSPNVPGGNWPSGNQSPLPEVRGIPCTGGNTGECIGLQESEAGTPVVRPHSSLSSSP
jgi:hypothetical protein